MKLPMTNVALKYQGWAGTWIVVGVDLTKHTQKVMVITCSQGGQNMPTKENLPGGKDQNEEPSIEFEMGRGGRINIVEQL